MLGEKRNKEKKRNEKGLNMQCDAAESKNGAECDGKRRLFGGCVCE